MWTGWGSEDNCLLFEGGTYGAGGHQHEDKIHFVIHAQSQRFFADTGQNKYDGSGEHRFSMSARAHATIAVDGQEQHRRPRWEKLMPMDTGPDTWFTGPDFDCVCSTYGAIPQEGWGQTQTHDNPEMILPLETHRRKILFLKADAWLVVDLLDPVHAESGSMHSYEGQFHFDPTVELKREQAGFLATGKNGATLAITPP